MPTTIRESGFSDEEREILREMAGAWRGWIFVVRISRIAFKAAMGLGVLLGAWAAVKGPLIEVIRGWVG